ncbi:MAG: 30S ribosomal protein S15 [Candidatus Parcubacteria bacterium]|nr:30S ribosomal protein S15 [Candidatus Parcubacteria bacterium]
MYMLKPEEKTSIIAKFKQHETDSGSAEVQVALLSEEIKRLLSHLKDHPKDFHSKRGLLKMVTKRRSLLVYLEIENPRRYNSIIKKIGLKKSAVQKKGPKKAIKRKK